jgi:hypothetical protein
MILLNTFGLSNSIEGCVESTELPNSDFYNMVSDKFAASLILFLKP